MFKRKKKSSADIIQDETLKSLRKIIKGYEHYKEKDVRKSTDEALRAYFYDRMVELSDIYSKVHGQLLSAQILSAWQASNYIQKELQDLRKYLSDDVYRHSTFFEANDVTSIIEISIIYILESETLLTIENCKSLSEKIYEDLVNVNMLEVEKEILQLQRAIREISNNIKDRGELIASFELVGV
ncbi:MAG: hypothetical protein INQ03_11930 [Candidatus Heimdallarchaeota archaeon]|nr:hypothetical protein [Candidatus Heimdallarchaeota archaeon]